MLYFQRIDKLALDRWPAPRSEFMTSLSDGGRGCMTAERFRKFAFQSNAYAESLSGS
jgi:hypothetical protein